MSKFARSNIAPVYEVFGQAVFQAQLLEEALELLIRMLDANGSKGSAKFAIDVPDAPKTIGVLFREVRLRKYLTKMQRGIIQTGVRERNFLIHAYWQNQRSLALRTTAGRRWLVKDLRRIDKACREASRIVDSIADEYLRGHGTSYEQLAEPLWQIWESSSEPPLEVLH